MFSFSKIILIMMETINHCLFGTNYNYHIWLHNYLFWFLWYFPVKEKHSWSLCPKAALCRGGLLRELLYVQEKHAGNNNNKKTMKNNNNFSTKVGVFLQLLQLTDHKWVAILNPAKTTALNSDYIFFKTKRYHVVILKNNDPSSFQKEGLPH